MTYLRSADRVVLTPAMASTIPVANLTDWLALLSEEGGKQFFPLGDDNFEFDLGQLAANAIDVLARIVEEEESVTVGGLLELPRVLRPEPKNSSSKLWHSFAAVTPVAYPTANEWPVSEIMPGLIVVLGDTGAGKTHYLWHDAGVQMIIRNSEPLEDVDLDERIINVHNTIQAIELGLLLSMLKLRVGIDSFRTLVYDLSGAAMAGGMSAALFSVVTNINNMFAAAGGTAMAAINPMLAKVEEGDRLYQRLGATAVGAVHLVDKSVRAHTYRKITGRTDSAGTSSFSLHAEPQGVNPVSAGGKYSPLNRMNVDDVDRKASRLAPGLTDHDDDYDATPRTFPKFDI